MTELVHKAEGLSLEELEAHTGELLPAREQMQLVDLTFQVAPVVQVPIAANILSPDSNAAAIAQSNVIQQNADASGTGIGIGILGDGTGVGTGGVATNTATATNAAAITQTT